jgi:PAS domain S-box-containing protein
MMKLTNWGPGKARSRKRGTNRRAPRSTRGNWVRQLNEPGREGSGSRDSGEGNETLLVLDQLMDSVEQALLVVDRNGEILRANPAAADLMESGEASILGRPFSVCCSGYGLPATPLELKCLSANGHLKGVRGDLRTAVGTEAPVSFSFDLIFDREGAIAGMTVMIEDIRRHQALIDELARRHSEHREQVMRQRILALKEISRTHIRDSQGLGDAFRKINEIATRALDAERGAIWLFDEKHTRLVCNDLYEVGDNYHSWGEELQAGQYPFFFAAVEDGGTIAAHDVFHDSRTHEFSETYWRMFGITSMLAAPILVWGRNVGVVCYQHVGPMRQWTAEEEVFAGSVADFVAMAIEAAERKRIEEERAQLLIREREARQAAEEANRLKDDFLAVVSHELRAPLTSVLGWTDILRGGGVDELTAKRALQTIERNVKTQVHLVGDLLDASRIATGKMKLEVRSADLRAIVEAVIDSVRPLVEEKRLRFQIALDPVIGPFTGDPERLKQIVWNLLLNAIKFTPAHGLIEVRLERLENKALLIVSDTGQGIKAEFLPHLFDRFRQADGSVSRRAGGLGLGLSIVKHLVELHNGAIYAYSGGEGQGTDMMVTLPLAAEAPDPVESPAKTRERRNAQRIAALRGVHVLVVDDEYDTREVLSMMLSRYGAEVRMAAATSEALKVLTSSWRPDVLVSDIAMPGEDGYALIRQVRAMPADCGGSIPAIALTSFAGSQDRTRALSTGFQIHLAKPIEPAELARMVARVTVGNDLAIV